MNQIFLFPVTEMLDITKIEEYNQEFIKAYPNGWEPFVTKNNFDEYLRRMNNYKEGKDNDGLKEIFYWLFDKDKIVGSGSIRLNPEIDKIIETYKNRVEIEKYCHVAPLSEIKENDYNLNIPRYVDTFEEEEEIDIKAVQQELKDIDKEIAEVDKELNVYLKELRLEEL